MVAERSNKTRKETVLGNEILSEMERKLRETLRGVRVVGVRLIRKEKTCQDAIKLLCNEGWFAFPRTAGEVYRELRVRGYNYGKSRVSHSLASLAKDGYLRRIGRPREYRYFSTEMRKT
ncbi:MAG: hypothetical protein QXY74_05200 [Candidatus Bathyarchaeia archaeon]